MTKIYLNNRVIILLYSFRDGWTAQQCFQATKFIGECYSDKNAKTEPIYLLKEMMENTKDLEENKKHDEEVIKNSKKIVRRKEWKNFNKIDEVNKWCLKLLNYF